MILFFFFCLLLLSPIKAQSFAKNIKVLTSSICFHLFYEHFLKSLLSAYTPLMVVKDKGKFNLNHSDFPANSHLTPRARTSMCGHFSV